MSNMVKAENVPVQPDPHKRNLAPGADLIKHFEGCKLEAYWDSRGQVWTIGWGTTKGIKKGMVITKAHADQLFNADFYLFCSVIQRAIKVSVNDNEFSAMVSLAYNIGEQAFYDSTLLRWLNEGEPRSQVALRFAPFDRAGGKVEEGLVRRRAAEKALFLTPVKPKASA